MGNRYLTKFVLGDMQQSYMMELETEVAKLKERNEELQRKQVYFMY